MKYSGDTSSAYKYSTRGIIGSDYLAFRDLPDIFAKNITGGLALDYGCGTGRSTRFLKENNFDTVGIDVSRSMLDKAKRVDPEGSYILIEEDHIPFDSGVFALVFTSFMLLELPSKEQLIRCLQEARRVLHKSGMMVVITNTQSFYSGKWLSCDVDFPENEGHLRSGQKVRVRLLPENVEITDYYWSDEDYKEAFDDAGFSVLEEHRPLGRSSDGVEWIDETRSAPYVVYVLTPVGDLSAETRRLES